MKKCLWIVPKLIYPVSDGARVANQSLLKSIRPHFEKMDIVVFRENHDEDLHLELYKENFKPDKIHVLDRSSATTKFRKYRNLLLNFLKAPHLPVTTGHFCTSRLKRDIKKIVQECQYDLLVLDGLHPYSALLDLEKENLLPPIVYRAHNVEQDLWLTAASQTSNPIKRYLLLWQGKKMARLERTLVEKSRRVWAIAIEDQRRFEEMSGLKNIHHVPVGLEFVREKIFMPSPLRTEKIKLLFVGKLDWAPNKDGLRWFLHEIWPFIDHSKLELNIVGGGDASWAECFYAFPGIRFHGFVKNLDDMYGKSDYSIIPIRFGSGTRIKVVESISKGVPVISTSMGVQGSGLDENEYIEANDAQDWINTLNNLKIDLMQEKAQRAFVKFEQTYSPLKIGESAFLSLQT